MMATVPRASKPDAAAVTGFWKSIETILHFETKIIQ